MDQYPTALSDCLNVVFINSSHRQSTVTDANSHLVPDAPSEQLYNATPTEQLTATEIPTGTVVTPSATTGAEQQTASGQNYNYYFNYPYDQSQWWNSGTQPYSDYGNQNWNTGTWEYYYPYNAGWGANNWGANQLQPTVTPTNSTMATQSGKSTTLSTFVPNPNAPLPTITTPTTTTTTSEQAPAEDMDMDEGEASSTSSSVSGTYLTTTTTTPLTVMPTTVPNTFGAATNGVYSYSAFAPATAPHSLGQKVPVKVTLQKPPQVKKRALWGQQNTASNGQPQKKFKQTTDQFPDDLRNFVERAFEQYEGDDGAKEKIEDKLRIIITNAIQSQTIHSTDWNSFPLPSLSEEPEISYTKSKFTLGLSQEPLNKKKGKKIVDPIALNSEFVPLSDIKKLSERQKRFDTSATTTTATVTSNLPPWRRQAKKKQEIAQKLAFSEEDVEGMAVVGTCQVLEKPFLRLTSVPDPAQVRPEPVLRKALTMVKERWKQDEDWGWTCEQLKSIRQDLTVQQIHNKFTVEVYETHARLCLENHDAPEFNQCQSRLMTLYKMNVEGCHAEFTAYRILYSLYEHSLVSTTKMLAEIPAYLLQHADVRHAMKVLSAYSEDNFHKFFKLYWNAPNMGGYLLDFVIGNTRRKAMTIYTKVYRPHLEVSFLVQELGFEKTQECITFLEDHQCVFGPRKNIVLCKESFLGLKRWEKENEEKHRLDEGSSLSL